MLIVLFIQQFLGFLGLASTTLAAPAADNHGAGTTQPSTQGVKWGECGSTTKSLLPARCGTLAVPLDYEDPSPNATLDLALIMVPSVKQPAKGNIIFNFGGPGLVAIDSLASGSEGLMV
jgi:hypothetical protein